MTDKKTLFSGEHSVSRATLRSQDLLPAFLLALGIVSPEYYAVVIEEFHWLEDGDTEDNPFWETEECADLINSLVETLDQFAPAGMYFGAHEGDGSDYGYWKSSDYLEGIRTTNTAEDLSQDL